MLDEQGQENYPEELSQPVQQVEQQNSWSVPTPQTETIGSQTGLASKKLITWLVVGVVTISLLGLGGYFVVSKLKNNNDSNKNSSLNLNTKAESKSEDNLKVSWNITENVAFVTVENTSNDFIGNLEIDIKSSGGELGKAGFQPVVIPPGGKSVYAVSVYGPNDKITAKVTGDTIKNRYVTGLKATDTGWNSAYKGLFTPFKGSLKNTSGMKIKNPRVAQIVYDTDGKVAAITMINEYLLWIEPGATAQITFTPSLPVDFVYGSHEYVTYGEIE